MPQCLSTASIFIYLFIFVPPLEGVSVKEIDVKM